MNLESSISKHLKSYEGLTCEAGGWLDTIESVRFKSIPFSDSFQVIAELKYHGAVNAEEVTLKGDDHGV